METRQPKVVTDGFYTTHDMACAVCSEGPAVLDTNVGVFQPCWLCQASGWELKHRKRKLWRRRTKR